MFPLFFSLLLYLSLLMPGIFLSGIPFYLIIFSLLLVALFSNSRLPGFLFLVLFSLSFSLDSSHVRLAFSSEEVSHVYGRLVKDPGFSENRMVSFHLRLEGVSTSEGWLGSAKGVVLIIAKENGLLLGDYVSVRGSFVEDGLFLAEEVVHLERPIHTRVRKKLLDTVTGRLSGLGDRQKELAMRLLLSNGLDGDGEIISLARSCGVSHTIALSGMHLEIIASCLTPLMFFLPSTTRRRLLLLPLFLFSFLSAFTPSLLRALLFQCISTFTDIRNEERLVCTFLLQALLSPWMLLGMSGMYSYLAIAALIFSSRFPSCLKTSTFFLSSLILVFTTPYTLISFSTWTAGSILLTPAVTLVIRLYMVFSLIHLVIPLFSVPVSILYGVLEFLLSLPMSFLTGLGLGEYLIFSSLFLVTVILVCRGSCVKRIFQVSSLCVESQL